MKFTQDHSTVITFLVVLFMTMSIGLSFTMKKLDSSAIFLIVFITSNIIVFMAMFSSENLKLIKIVSGFYFVMTAGNIAGLALTVRSPFEIQQLSIVLITVSSVCMSLLLLGHSRNSPPPTYEDWDKDLDLPQYEQVTRPPSLLPRFTTQE